MVKQKRTRVSGDYSETTAAPEAARQIIRSLDSSPEDYGPDAPRRRGSKGNKSRSPSPSPRPSPRGGAGASEAFTEGYAPNIGHLIAPLPGQATLGPPCRSPRSPSRDLQVSSARGSPVASPRGYHQDGRGLTGQDQGLDDAMQKINRSHQLRAAGMAPLEYNTGPTTIGSNSGPVCMVLSNGRVVPYDSVDFSVTTFIDLWHLAKKSVRLDLSADADEEIGGMPNELNFFVANLSRSTDQHGLFAVQRAEHTLKAGSSCSYERLALQSYTGFIVLFLPRSFATVHVQQEDHKTLKVIRELMRSADANSSGQLSRGEFRVMLLRLPLQLENEQFDKVWHAFDVRSKGYVDLHDLTFHLGRPVLEQMPCDISKVLSETVMRIVNQRQDHPWGYKDSEDQEKSEYVTRQNSFGSGERGCMAGTIVCEIASLIASLLLLVLGIAGILPLALGLSGAFLSVFLYWFIIWGFHRDEIDTIEVGLDPVLKKIESLKNADVTFRWWMECSHLENVDDKHKRVGTMYSHTGKLSCIDTSPVFIPAKACKMCHIHLNCHIDVSTSDYLAQYDHWVDTNRTDKHTKCGREEYIEGLHDLHILATWAEEGLPWWAKWAWLLRICFCGPFLLLLLGSIVNHYDYTFVKKLHKMRKAAYVYEKCHYDS